MFKPTADAQPEVFKKEAKNVEKDYVIQKNDRLTLDIYSNKGERLIDPNPDMSGATVKSSSGSSSGGGNNSSSNQSSADPHSYLVDHNGIVKFPMIGELRLDSLTIRQAEEIVQKEYANFFKEPFVKMSFANKRVIILGAPGGEVLSLPNQNVSLAEVLAMAHGVDNLARADNLKVIRGEHVYQVDFSTIKGFRDGNMIIEPGDIVYIQPIRKPFVESMRDYYIFVYVLMTITTLIISKNL